MANPEHLKILKQGVDVWNGWRQERPEIVPDLTNVDLNGTDLGGANLSRAALHGAYLNDVNLRSANISYANLNSTELKGAKLREANLSYANLDTADLSQANLDLANLNSANLRGAILVGARIRAADLTDALLRNGWLNEASFRGTNLYYTNFVNSKLNLADFGGAMITKAIFNGAEVTGADFSKAIMADNIFADLDLSEVRGLDDVDHWGPSEISINTIYRSKGKISDVFLRGCGVPDSFINQITALVEAIEPIQFHSCFISYSHKDEEFARRLYSRMRDANLRVWYAPEEMKGGRKLHEQIFNAIHLHDKLLLVLSENSLQSEWVNTEIRRARKTEREENRRKLFPIRLADFEAIRAWECFDADSGKDLAVEIREYFIPDFSNWKDHNAFEASFDRLLRDLKASE